MNVKLLYILSYIYICITVDIINSKYIYWCQLMAQRLQGTIGGTEGSYTMILTKIYKVRIWAGESKKLLETRKRGDIEEARKHTRGQSRVKQTHTLGRCRGHRRIQSGAGQTITKAGKHTKTGCELNTGHKEFKIKPNPRPWPLYSCRGSCPGIRAFFILSEQVLDDKLSLTIT